MTGPGRLGVPDLRESLDSPRPPRLIDVRSPAEFESVHITGAYNVPLDTLREHRDELISHLDDEVVLVCRSGNRARQAESTLTSAGLTNLHVLDGGMLAWESAGGPVSRGRPRWDIERQVRLIAGSVVLGGVLGSLAVPGLQWVSAAAGGALALAALTNSCAMAALLARLPYNRGATCDLDAIVAQLATGAVART
jgi:rhodanese-related sulfurtransferase